MEAVAMMQKIGFSDPDRAYDWLMERRMYLNAAQVAQDFELPREKIVAAAEKAQAQMYQSGEHGAAREIVMRFKLNMLVASGARA